VHPDVSRAVDDLLRGFPITPETRSLDQAGRIQKVLSNEPSALKSPEAMVPSRPQYDGPATRVHSFGVDRGKLEQALRVAHAPVELVRQLKDADLMVTTKSYYRRSSEALKEAEKNGKPVYVLKRATPQLIEDFVRSISGGQKGRRMPEEELAIAIKEAEEAAEKVLGGSSSSVDLDIHGSYVRRLQHEVAQRYNLASASRGREPHRHVVIYR